MVGEAIRQEKGFEGLRPFDPARDLSQVTDLLRVAFGDEIGSGEGDLLRDFYFLQFTSPLLWLAQRISLEFQDMFGGFVWIEDQQVVGNVTLSRASPQSPNWLISNVATDPAYRRRGIARRLMEATLERAQARGAERVSLQVRHENTPAKNLYFDLGFRLLETTAELRRSPDTYMLPIRPEGVIVRAWRRGESSKAVELAQRVTPAPLQEFQPLREADYRSIFPPGPWEALVGLFTGQVAYRWAVPDGSTTDNFAAVLILRARRWGGSHHLQLMIRPDWRGRVEQPLIDHALADLARRELPRPIEADIRTDHAVAIDMLKGAGFQVKRVLDRMGLTFNPVIRIPVHSR